MNRLVETHSKKQLRTDIPEFGPGDRIKIWTLIREGEKERLQPFEGDVIRIRNRGIGSSFTVRKTSYGIGVERIFPRHSPIIAKVEVLRKGRVRRAKLYYLRKLSGKNARIREKRLN
ncbi:50S ribosomal protein L19 [bacterium]|nr:50S ribosomal protein L19 [candidate division CSSED10-310 bacterium]